MRNRRIGRFVVSNHLLHRLDIDDLKRLMEGFVVLGATQRFDLNGIEYTALCTDFEDVEEGQTIPLYDIKVEYHDYIFRSRTIEKRTSDFGLILPKSRKWWQFWLLS